MRTRVRTLRATLPPAGGRDGQAVAGTARASAALLADLWFELAAGGGALARAAGEIQAALNGDGGRGCGGGSGDGFGRAGADRDRRRHLVRMRRDLELAIATGALVIEEVSAPAHVPVLAEPPADEPLAVEARPEQEPFALVLLDRQTGAPLAAVPLTVRTTAGAAWALTTDARGEIRIAALPPGTCEVTSDAAGAHVRGAYAIRAGAGAPARAKGRAGAEAGTSAQASGDAADDAPAPPPPRLVTAIAHHVATGETPDAIARMWGVSWSDIARFNWGTDDPAALEDGL